MHEALKSLIYKEAKNILKQNNLVRIWTGYDDPTSSGCTEITNENTLKKVFKYAYDMGWPVIRIEPIQPITIK